MPLLGNIVRQHMIYFDKVNQVTKFQAYHRDVKIWMSFNLLLFNPDKTEVMAFGPKQNRNTLSDDIITLL